MENKVRNKAESMDNTKEDKRKDEEQGEKKQTYRKLTEISDEELRATAAKAKSFPELKRLLGINPNEKNERVKKRAEKAGCEGLLDGYHIGKSSRVDGMSREELQAIADECETYAEFGKRLGYEGGITGLSNMGKRIQQKYHLNFTSYNRYIRSHDKDYLQHIVDSCCSFSEVAEKLGYKSSSHIKKNLDKMDIDYAHFDLGYHGNRKEIDDLKENTHFTHAQLVRMLMEIREIKCEYCGLSNEWNGQALHLEIHHKNSNHSDNRIENLMIVCPNCHAVIEKRGVNDSKRSCAEQKIINEKGRCCEHCGNEKWQGSVLPIELHHVNEKDREYRIDNIEVLCPNCHQQTANYFFQERKATDEELVEALLTSKTRVEAIRKAGCSSNGHMYKRVNQLIEKHQLSHLFSPKEKTPHDKPLCKIKRELPDKQQLKDDIRTLSFQQIGRKYNVCGNAVVKWCKKLHLPWRKVDINSFNDEEWKQLETFDENMQKTRTLYDYDIIIDLLDNTRSMKYVAVKMNMSCEAIQNIKQRVGYRRHAIEWCQTTCHIIDTNLYFRTTADAGNWLAEQGSDLKYVIPEARGKRVKRYIEQKSPLFGYQFEYVKEEDYFDIIENHEVISYAYQEHREVPPQMKK